MPIAVEVAGLVTVRVDTGASNALEDLGYTRNGADVRSQGFFLGIPGDENGGDEGPPVDIQYFGEIATVRMELTKFDRAIVDKVKSRIYGNTVATAFSPSAAGSLMFGGSLTFRVLLACTTQPRNFPRCVLKEPIEINKGTKYSTLLLEFEAHKNAAGVLWNEAIS